MQFQPGQSGNPGGRPKGNFLPALDGAKSELAKVYADKADILKNQLSFKNVGMTFKAYADQEDFVAV